MNRIGALIALGFLMLSLSAACGGGGGGDSGGGSASTSGGSKAKGTREEPVPVGQVGVMEIIDHRWDVKVVSADLDAYSKFASNSRVKAPQTGEKLVVVRLSAKETYNKDKDDLGRQDWTNFAVTGTSGKEFKGGACIGIPDLLDQISNGKTQTEGNTCFYVPATESKLALSMSSASNKTYFALQ